SPVTPARRCSVPNGGGAAAVEPTRTRPHRLPSTLIGAATADSIPITFAVSAAGPGAYASTRAGRPVRRTCAATPPSATSKRRPTGTSVAAALQPATSVPSLPDSYRVTYAWLTSTSRPT